LDCTAATYYDHRCLAAIADPCYPALTTVPPVLDRRCLDQAHPSLRSASCATNRTGHLYRARHHVPPLPGPPLTAQATSTMPSLDHQRKKKKKAGGHRR
jgi:hypothetical protein